MRKLFLLSAIFFGIFFVNIEMSYADVIPTHVSLKYTNTIGLYQIGNEFTIYKKPDEKSNIVYNVRWNNKEVLPMSLTFDDLFVVFVPSKSLALLAVTDEDETENWIEVIYNNNTGSRGWIKKDDPYKFMSWINFYNMYGRKYGLYVLKGSPSEVNDLHSSTEENSQAVAHLNMPEKINLTAIRGNWALVSVRDMDKMPKTGYMKWRSDKGVKYLFPDIK